MACRQRKMNEIMKRMSQFIKNITTGGERRGRAYKGMMSGGKNRKNSALWCLNMLVTMEARRRRTAV